MEEAFQETEPLARSRRVTSTQTARFLAESSAALLQRSPGDEGLMLGSPWFRLSFLLPIQIFLQQHCAGCTTERPGGHHAASPIAGFILRVYPPVRRKFKPNGGLCSRVTFPNRRLRAFEKVKTRNAAEAVDNEGFWGCLSQLQ